MIRRLLIANRGEIAIRIARAAAELDVRSVAVYSCDDAASLHVRKADEAVALPGTGAAAYLDAGRIVDTAVRAGCDALHPGSGFLSESPSLARRCEAAGIVFVGPDADTLALLGDKARARAFAQAHGVAVVDGSGAAVTLAQAQAFMASPASGGAVLIKAVAGGGGRGIRIVTQAHELADAYAACSSEALSSFGSGDVYVERLVRRPRHLEVQVLGDGQAVVHMGERDCTLQRRHQKLVEMAPGPALDGTLREALCGAALCLAQATSYRGLGTFEFLVEPGAQRGAARWSFIEANPRLQVEHPVTEMVTGLDLVRLQLQVAGGATLAGLGLTQARAARCWGRAIELRINAETPAADGSTQAGSGRLTRFEPPSGPGVRADTAAHAGHAINPLFDSMLAKLIVHTVDDDLGVLLRKADRALAEFAIDGVSTNRALLHGLLNDAEVAAGRVHTRFVEEQAARLLEAGGRAQRQLYGPIEGPATPATPAAPDAPQAAPPGSVAAEAPTQGVLISVDVEEGDTVQAGQALAVIEAMKMQHVIESPAAGTVLQVLVRAGDSAGLGAPIAFIDPDGRATARQAAAAEPDLDTVPPLLAEVQRRQALKLDAERPQAVQRRRGRGQRTARENIDALMDPGSMAEYGGLAVAAQHASRTADDLARQTPADGIVIGIGTVNAAMFGSPRARCMALAYDFTVLAGTQGRTSHEKTDRALQLAHRACLPLVLFAEGGGGRAGSDGNAVPRLDVPTFSRFARLSGLVPRIGIVSGYSFAGNAALLGLCDVIIATRNASFGMAGPAMIEGGGLGIFKPEEVGPVSFQAPNGVIDVLVDDELAAVAVAQRCLGYFQGVRSDWQAGDARRLRHLVPENRSRAYDVRAVIAALADTGSVLELRRDFGAGLVTALVRIEGVPFGLIANNPQHLGGAIDSPASDKAARFMQLCDAFDLPLVSLCDTPGFMVGPEAEKTALVRHVSRLFVTAANISVPLFAIVLRKGYGLGAQAMAGGGFHEPHFMVAWPTGEFGAMGLEGAVRLAHKKELEALADLAERKVRFDTLVARDYQHGKAIHLAAHAVIDDVIDPADSRARILAGWRSLPPAPPRTGKKRPFVDTW